MAPPQRRDAIISVDVIFFRERRLRANFRRALAVAKGGAGVYTLAHDPDRRR